MRRRYSRHNNMLAGIAAFALLSPLQVPEHKLGYPRLKEGPVSLGWNDEFDYSGSWRALESDNKAGVVSEAGKVKLVLGPVPEGWPYEYQWSGVQREMRIDVARYPYLIAKVDNVAGYAHVDIDVLDAEKKPVKGLRASTLQTSGVSWIDLSKELDPAVYTLRIRLIVGGANTGCSVSYDWLRFTSPEDGKILLAQPDYPFIAPISRGQ